jgi:predicted hotdog family 3-hydroxylacyl-ACP dehydratase
MQSQTLPPLPQALPTPTHTSTVTPLPDVPDLPDIASLVPHSATMLLLDRVVAADNDTLQAEVIINEQTLFAEAQGVGSWIGIEYMAQAVAAFAGLYAMRQAHADPTSAAHTKPVKIGFLLGSRRYTATQGTFPLGSCLQVHVERLLQADNGLGSFDCFIANDNERVATATLTVFQPPDLATFLKEGAV